MRASSGPLVRSKLVADVTNAAVAMSLAAVVVVGCQGRQPSSPGLKRTDEPRTSVKQTPDPSRPHVAELNLSQGIPEVSRSTLFGTPKKKSLTDLVLQLDDIAKRNADKAEGVLVTFGSSGIGMGKAYEVAQALAKVRAASIPVVCHADDYGNATLWIASTGCDRIWLTPSGSVDAIGIGAQVLYASKLLNELSVDVDMLHVGKFKSASEPYTRDGPSDEARESLQAVLKSIRGSWLDAIAKGRGDQAKQAAESGPYTPDEARSNKLVDDIGYLDDARRDAQARASVDQSVVRFGKGARDPDDSPLVGLIRILGGAPATQDAPHVALIRAVGAIGMEPSQSVVGDSSSISERVLSKQLARIARNEGTKAVVLRIDSPGGSALASDLLWKSLMDLRRRKPLVVSVGDMAASGGYYMACTGARIFAEPTSIVGSIGVVGGKLSVGRTLERFGVHAETFAASDANGAQQRASMLSPFQAWDDPTRQRVMATMTHVYDLFVRRVAEARGRPIDQVAAIAEGRIFSAQDGLQNGLIDELGGVQQAIVHARRLAGLDEHTPVELIGEDGGLQRWLELDEDDIAQERLRGILGTTSTPWAKLADKAPELLGFGRAFEPILNGEHALVAVPFAVLIR